MSEAENTPLVHATDEDCLQQLTGGLAEPRVHQELSDLEIGPLPRRGEGKQNPSLSELIGDLDDLAPPNGPPHT